MGKNKKGNLKPIPAGNKGLPKLPKEVRNRMGYMENGGGLASMAESFPETDKMSYAKGGIVRENNMLMGYEPYFEKNVSIAYIDDNSKIVKPTMGYFPKHPMSKKAIDWAKRNGYQYIADGKKYAKGGGVGEGKTYKINNTTAIENEVNKFLHSLKLKDGYSNSMGTFTAKLTLEQFNKLVALIIGHDKNDNVYILDSSNNVVYDSKEARSKRKEMFKNYAKGGGVGENRMYNFLKEDLAKLENSIKSNDTNEIDKFFSYWNIHLKSLQYAKGGGVGNAKYDELYRKANNNVQGALELYASELGIYNMFYGHKVDSNKKAKVKKLQAYLESKYAKGGGVDSKAYRAGEAVGKFIRETKKSFVYTIGGL